MDGRSGADAGGAADVAAAITICGDSGSVGVRKWLGLHDGVLACEVVFVEGQIGTSELLLKRVVKHGASSLDEPGEVWERAAGGE